MYAKVYIATPHSGGWISRNIKHQEFSVRSYSIKASHISNTKTKRCYTCMFQKFIFGNGNFYNIFVRGIF